MTRRRFTNPEASGGRTGDGEHARRAGGTDTHFGLFSPGVRPRDYVTLVEAEAAYLAAIEKLGGAA